MAIRITIQCARKVQPTPGPGKPRKAASGKQAVCVKSPGRESRTTYSTAGYSSESTGAPPAVGVGRLDLLAFFGTGGSVGTLTLGFLALALSSSRGGGADAATDCSESEPRYASIIYIR